MPFTSTGLPSPGKARRRGAVLAGLALPLALLAAAQPSTSSADIRPDSAVAKQQRTPASDNPLAGRRWGVYTGRAELAYEPYAKATGEQKDLLAKIALRPKAKWFGAWIPNKDITWKVNDYIANATGGDPDVLVQMTLFRMQPWEHDACAALPTEEQQASYRDWTDRFAAAIGNAHVAMILQADGPFALCAPGGSKLPSHLIRYSARVFGALPHTSVYIDGGAADWMRDDPARAARILVPAGVEGVRGFALNSTHYDSTGREIAFGTSVVEELAARGIPGKHFVINTSSNGRPFPGYEYDGPNFNNARVCKTLDQRRCVTLGIPPTTDVDNPKWGLSVKNLARAAEHVDGYLWFGRPWLYNQASPFVMKRALAEARTTPY